MNANRYRLIFDKRTGMLVPVAEFTTGAKKGNSPGMGDGMGETSTPKWNQLCAAVALAAGGLGSGTLNAQIVPDGTTQTTVTRTAADKPLINIANPNASGLSHNKFTQFNADGTGPIFNNSMVYSATIGGGFALKNPHLSRNATSILTEVTGTDISRLRGQMEIHGGTPVDLIIANPNGLDLNRRLPFSWYPKQYEVSVPDAVAPELILGAFNVGRKGIIAGSFQSNPRFETKMDRAGFAARQKTLLDQHTLVSSALDDVHEQWSWQREPGLEAILRHDRAKLEWKLDGLYREQEAAARRDANRRDFLDTTLKD